MENMQSSYECARNGRRVECETTDALSPSRVAVLTKWQRGGTVFKRVKVVAEEPEAFAASSHRFYTLTHSVNSLLSISHKHVYWDSLAACKLVFASCFYSPFQSNHNLRI